MTLSKNGHNISLRVRYHEIDRMGVVYYANYYKWFEAGRTEWLRSHGMSYMEFEDMGILLPVLKSSCRYIAPARYDDRISIATTVVDARRSRVIFDYRVTNIDTGLSLATGNTTHLFVDRNMNRLHDKSLLDIIDSVLNTGGNEK